jgi:hypothetical protein
VCVYPRGVAAGTDEHGEGEERGCLLWQPLTDGGELM